MSDLLSIHIKSLCVEDTDVPRFYDLIHRKPQVQSKETSEEIIARFAPLRRKS